MWVQLLSQKRLEVRGVPTQYYPGDWVEIGRQTGTAWIAQGEARVQEFDPKDFAVKGAGIVVRGDPLLGAGKLDPLKPTLVGVTYGDPLLAYERTLIWETTVHLRPELVHVGFNLLDVWQIAVPLCDYRLLALHVGTDDERAVTQAVIRDLRVPLYDPRLMFVRDAPETRQLLDGWQAAVLAGSDERLALLRAIYTVKPLICALPVTWTNQSYVA